MTVTFKKNKEKKLSDEKIILERELAEYQKRLKLAKAEFSTYKIAIKAASKKKLLDVLRSIRKVHEGKLLILEKDLKSEVMKGHALKLKLEQTHSEKVKQLNKKLLSESQAKQLVIKKKIEKVKSKGEEEIKKAQMNSKLQIESEKAKARKKIVKLQKEIAKFKKSSLKEKLALEKLILNAHTRTSELKTQLEMQRKQSKQKDQE